MERIVRTLMKAMFVCGARPNIMKIAPRSRPWGEMGSPRPDGFGGDQLVVGG